MNKEEQDKLWNELSEESKKLLIKRYNMWDTETDNGRPRKNEYEQVFGSHNINLKPLTYDDIITELSKNETNIIHGRTYHSFKQFEKEDAIHKLLNVAKYLNEDWQPDWNDTTEIKYFIGLCNGMINTSFICNYRSMDVYFRSAKLAKQAIEILGEDTIKLALSTNY